jgi:hypothetical protein
VVKEVEAVLENRLSGVSNKDFTTSGGIKDLVSILNMVDRGTEKRIIEALENEDPNWPRKSKKCCLSSKTSLPWTIIRFRGLCRKLTLKIWLWHLRVPIKRWETKYLKTSPESQRNAHGRY